jgi:hypothetical protein
MAAERHFTPAEVEALIPRLTAIMDRVRGAHAEATARQERLRAVRQRIEMTGGGVIDRAAWRDDAATLERATAAVREGLDEVLALGGVPKDLGLGLVDFPHLRRGETVHLCWKYGEQGIRFWHGLDEGYAARKPL